MSNQVAGAESFGRMLSEVVASISDEEVAAAQGTAREITAQDECMPFRMFAAAPPKDTPLE